MVVTDEGAQPLAELIETPRGESLPNYRFMSTDANAEYPFVDVSYHISRKGGRRGITFKVLGPFALTERFSRSESRRLSPNIINMEVSTTDLDVDEREKTASALGETIFKLLEISGR